MMYQYRKDISVFSICRVITTTSFWNAHMEGN